MATTAPAGPVPLPAKHDAIRTAYDLRDQLASAKRRTALLIGAGCSMAVKVPGLVQLTKIVESTLAPPFQDQFREQIKTLGPSANLETALNRIRVIRELLEGTTRTYESLGFEDVRKLDIAICKVIYDQLALPPATGLKPHKSLAAWLRQVVRDSPIEIFTTNYDLLLEISLEFVGVPYFDGFVGSVAPFFVPESVEAERDKESGDDYPPRSWIRLWKLHGSIGWQLIPGTSPNLGKICRLTGGSVPTADAQLLIYPSREKYVQARRLPFLVYMDRLRRLTQSGECLLIISGYSFSDDHINEIVAQGLRANPRLAVAALLFGEPTEFVRGLAEAHKNFSFLAPESASIGGLHGGWLPTRPKAAGEEWPFWDEVNKKFTLGDFSRFGEFLDLMTGQSIAVPAPGTSAAPAAASSGPAVVPASVVKP